MRFWGVVAQIAVACTVLISFCGLAYAEAKRIDASLFSTIDAALERFPGRLNLGVFSCWREYDSSVLL